MDDLISRQAAIDIVQGYAEQLQGYIGMPNDSEVYAYARGLLLSIDRNIKALLSAQPEVLACGEGELIAQPEIIRCKDCKHWKDSDGVYRRGINAESKCPVNIRAVYEGNFYCADAERRTDE